MLANKITEARSTKGEDIRKENVTPIGRPAFVKPIKMGIDEHEQKGVTVPRRAPIMLAKGPFTLLKIARVRSGAKKDWM